MFATDEIGRLRMLSMRQLMALTWVLPDQNENSTPDEDRDGNYTTMMQRGVEDDEKMCLHDLEELSVLEEACIINVLLASDEIEAKFGHRRLEGKCSEEELFALASRRCELHRSEAQEMKWSDSLEALSEEVAQDLQTWATHQCLDDRSERSGGCSSSRRLATQQQLFAQTVASISELDQLLAKLRLLHLHGPGSQGLEPVDADSLLRLWAELPASVRSALLRMSTVCGIGSLLYVVNLHKLAIYVGHWQLERLENFGEEYYSQKNPKLHNMRRHMTGFRIFGDIMEDLWGGEPLEIFFVRLRRLQRQLLLWIDRITRLYDVAEDADSDEWSFPADVRTSAGAGRRNCVEDLGALLRLSELEEVLDSGSGHQSAPPAAAAHATLLGPRGGRSSDFPEDCHSAPPAAALGPATLCSDQHHDQRGKLKKEKVEPLVAFIGCAGADYLEDVGCFPGVDEGAGGSGHNSKKSIAMMHLEKRSSSGLAGCSGRRVGATAVGEGAAQKELCTPKDEDEELELVITRLPPGFGSAEVIEALTHAAGAGRPGIAEGEPDHADGSATEPVRPSTLPREVYRRTKGGARFVPLLQRRQ
eukprot:g4551.t1